MTADGADASDARDRSAGPSGPGDRSAGGRGAALPGRSWLIAVDIRGVETSLMRATRDLRCGLGLALVLFVPGCGERDAGSGGERSDAAPLVQGQPIRRPSDRTNAGAGAVAPPSPSAGGRVRETVVNGYLQLGFETLSGFDYRVYEYYAEGVSGRPLLKSDDVIPPAVKALDGRGVTVRGYVLPLRTRAGRVTEFLLLRDQGTCCFGPQAQINHFIRVTFPGGRTFESGLPYRVSGELRVGETYVQGYLTGIYQLAAAVVDESR